MILWCYEDGLGRGVRGGRRNLNLEVSGFWVEEERDFQIEENLGLRV